jgi:hypothetical protein
MFQFRNTISENQPPMSKSNELIPASVLANVPAQMGDDSDFQDLSQGGGYLRRLQLVSKGKYVDSGQVKPGNYAIIIDGDNAQDLGNSVDVLVVSRRPKALDMSDKSQIVVSYDKKSELFQEIAAKSEEKDSGCQYGASFLVIERSTGALYELFCGSVSARREVDTISGYMAVTAEQIKARDLKGVEPHGPLPATLTSKYIQSRYNYFVPEVHDCSTPFTAQQVPEEAVIVKEMDKFVHPPKDDTKVVKNDGNRRAR